jgi:hypothetical protein
MRVFGLPQLRCGRWTADLAEKKPLPAVVLVQNLELVALRSKGRALRLWSRG